MSCVFVCSEIAPRQGAARLLLVLPSIPGGLLCGPSLPSLAPPGPGSQRWPWEGRGLSLRHAPAPSGASPNCGNPAEDLEKGGRA